MLTEEERHRLMVLVTQGAGLRMEGLQKERLEQSVAERLRARGIRHVADYLSLLEGGDANGEERLELFSLLTIQETSFFRHAEQFEVFQLHVLPDLHSRRLAQRRLNIWSAGCSTGEEPYTIALLLNETPALDGWTVEVLGTDLNPRYLERARAALFAPRSLSAVPSEFRKRYFMPHGNRERLRADIAEKVTFRQFNLTDESYPLPTQGTWDIIFCRNVVIYFPPEVIHKVMAKFSRVLADDGYLFLGYSESLQGISPEFAPVQFGEAFVYRKAVGRLTGESERSLKAKRVKKSMSRGLKEPASQRSDESTSPRLTESLGPPVADLPAQEFEETLRKCKLDADEGRFAEAAAVAQRLTEQNPFLLEAHYLLGVVCEQSGDVQGAVEAFRRCVYLEPTCAMAHFHLGRLYLEQRQRKAGLRELHRALRLLKEMPEGVPVPFSDDLPVTLLAQACERQIERLTKK